MPCIGSIERAERRVVTRLVKDGITTNLMGSYSPRRIRISISYTVFASFFFWFVCSFIFFVPLRSQKYQKNKMTQDIPIGRTKEEIKIRERLIKEFYSQWIAEHPDKKVLNFALGKFISVKFLSINETYEKAARNYESTLAVFNLTEILQNAMLVEELPAKRNTRNQKQFEKLLVLQYKDVKLTVGLQRSNQDLVQYCITVPQKQNPT